MQGGMAMTAIAGPAASDDLLERALDQRLALVPDPVHCGIGLLEDLLHAQRRIDQQLDADAGRSLVPASAEPVVLLEQIENLVSHVVHMIRGIGLGLSQVLQHDDKFISPKPGHGVGLTHRQLKPPCNFDQQLVVGADAELTQCADCS